MERRATRPWLRVLLLIALLIVVGSELYRAGGVSLVIVAVLWPIGPVCGMQFAARSAPASKWNGSTTNLRLIMGYVLVWSGMLLPAIACFLFGSPLIGGACALTSIISAAAVCVLWKLLWGPISPPTA
jgi:hypothetical protein